MLTSLVSKMTLQLHVLSGILVLTTPGERFFNEDLGSGVSEVLFDTLDDISGAVIRDEIEQTVITILPKILIIFINYLLLNILKRDIYINNKSVYQN